MSLCIFKHTQCSVPLQAYPARLSLEVPLQVGVHVHKKWVDLGVQSALGCSSDLS